MFATMKCKIFLKKYTHNGDFSKQKTIIRILKTKMIPGHKERSLPLDVPWMLISFPELASQQCKAVCLNEPLE